MPAKYLVMYVLSALAVLFSIYGVIVNSEPQIFYKRFHGKHFVIAGVLVIFTALVGLFVHV